MFSLCIICLQQLDIIANVKVTMFFLDNIGLFCTCAIDSECAGLLNFVMYFLSV